MTLYKGKYRIESARRPGYDYSSPGSYFITICTKDRIHYFGDVVVVETPDSGVSTTPIAKIQLSDAGKIADKYWNEIPEHFPQVILDTFQIMPNHIHGIIQIIDLHVQTPDCGVSIPFLPFEKETPDSGISAQNAHGRPTIGIIINQFKRICTLKTNKSGINFAWQPRFHDHIILDDMELQRIRTYIINNLHNWVYDKFNK